MTFPAGDPDRTPRDDAGRADEASHQAYEAPPIEEMPAGSYEATPGTAAPPAGPGGFPVPPGGYPPPGYGTPPPGYGIPPPGYGIPPPGYGPQPYSGWPGQPAGFGPVPNRTNPLAVWSVVASITGLLCGIGSIIGIALGFVALSQIKRTGQGGHGLAVAGIAIGFASAVLALIGAYYMSR